LYVVFFLHPAILLSWFILSKQLILRCTKSMGIENLYKVDPYDVEQVKTALKDALAAKGPSVIIAQQKCVLLPEMRASWEPLSIDEDQCNGCGLCFRIGCPAIVRSEKVDGRTGRALAEIDNFLCTGCEICAQVCARGAILFRDQAADHAEMGE
jgi:indolepyruvate ferredoxin oxidoreductase alpha subunit